MKNISNNGQSGIKILILRDIDQDIIELGGQTPQVAEGELVRYGDQLAANVIAKKSGQIVAIDR